MSVSLGLFATGLLALSMGVSSLQPQRSIDITRIDNAALDSMILAAGKNYATKPLSINGQCMDNYDDYFWCITGYNFNNGYKFDPVVSYQYYYFYDEGEGYLSLELLDDDFNVYDVSLSFNGWIHALHDMVVTYTINGNTFDYFYCSNDNYWNATNFLDSIMHFSTNDKTKVSKSITGADFVVLRYVHTDSLNNYTDVSTGLIYKPTVNYPITFFVDNYINSSFPYVFSSYVGFDTLYWYDRNDNYTHSPEGIYNDYSLLSGINPQINYEYYYCSLGNNVNLNSDIGFGAYQPSAGQENVRSSLGSQRLHTQVSYNGLNFNNDTPVYESTFLSTRCYFDEFDEYDMFSSFAIYGYVVNKFAYDYSDDFTAIAQENYQRGYEDGRTVGLTQGYDNGYNRGYADGVSMGGNASFIGLFGSIADTPILMIRSLFDFDLFGINMLTVVLSLTTGLIVMFLIRKFI